MRKNLVQSQIEACWITRTTRRACDAFVTETLTTRSPIALANSNNNSSSSSCEVLPRAARKRSKSFPTLTGPKWNCVRTIISLMRRAPPPSTTQTTTRMLTLVNKRPVTCHKWSQLDSLNQRKNNLWANQSKFNNREKIFIFYFVY